MGDTLALFVSDRERDVPQVWQVTRMSSPAPWGDPLPVQELNNMGPHRDIWLSANGLEAFLRADVNGGDIVQS